ncbi:hypothetical protein [Hydrogenophaga sp. BPS33]|uniref:hypothetical protein n=1 Tax=Hydrogenophaga sp. BPS33 TaxID=2651974 RepID=UPI00135ACED7|nr:hypothetical protein [Hydrogenophaga sp. BPS33]
MDNPNAIPKFVEIQLAPLKERIAELEREVAKLKTEQQRPGILQRLGLKGAA